MWRKVLIFLDAKWQEVLIYSQVTEVDFAIMIIAVVSRPWNEVNLNIWSYVDIIVTIMQISSPYEREYIRMK